MQNTALKRWSWGFLSLSIFVVLTQIWSFSLQPEIGFLNFKKLDHQTYQIPSDGNSQFKENEITNYVSLYGSVRVPKAKSTSDKKTFNLGVGLFQRGHGWLNIFYHLFVAFIFYQLYLLFQLYAKGDYFSYQALAPFFRARTIFLIMAGTSMISDALSLYLRQVEKGFYEYAFVFSSSHIEDISLALLCWSLGHAMKFAKKLNDENKFIV